MLYTSTIDSVFAEPNPAGGNGFRIRVTKPKTAKLRLVDVSGVDVPVDVKIETGGTLLITPKAIIQAGVYLLHVQ